MAQPGTITSSIGVLGGKMLTRELWDEVGIDWAGVFTSAQGRLYNGYYDYSEAEWQSFQNWLDRIYTDFTSRVAEGRGMPLERVQEIAKGRVWTGRQGLELGLVDELGGFPVAIRLAKEAAGIDPDDDVRLRKYPREKTNWQKFMGSGPDNSEDLGKAALVGLLRQVQPLAADVRQVVVPPFVYGPVYEPMQAWRE